MNPLKWFSKRTEKTPARDPHSQWRSTGTPPSPDSSAGTPAGSESGAADGNALGDNPGIGLVDNLKKAILPTPPAPSAKFGQDAPTPVDRERVTDFLTAKEYKFTVDDNSNLFGIWDGNPFWFIFLGESKSCFQVRSRWKRELSESARASVLYAVNDWNRDKIWPKSAVFVDEEQHHLQVHAEVSFDFTAGATKPQFEYAFGYAMDTSMQFYEYMESRISPDWQGEAEQD